MRSNTIGKGGLECLSNGGRTDEWTDCGGWLTDGKALLRAESNSVADDERN